MTNTTDATGKVKEIKVYWVYDANYSSRVTFDNVETLLEYIKQNIIPCLEPEESCEIGVAEMTPKQFSKLKDADQL